MANFKYFADLNGETVELDRIHSLDNATSTTLADRILAMVERIEKKPASRGVLSTGEFIAVALVLNRFDWLKENKYTMLEAVDRLGEEWLQASFQVQRMRDTA